LLSVRRIVHLTHEHGRLPGQGDGLITNTDRYVTRTNVVQHDKTSSPSASALFNTIDRRWSTRSTGRDFAAGRAEIGTVIRRYSTSTSSFFRAVGASG
jgi:hypothetical protein